MARPKKDAGDTSDEVTEFGADIAADDENVPDAAVASSELTEQEKLQLEAEARKEVAAAVKASKMKAFKAAVKKRIQAESYGLGEGVDDKGQNLVEVAMDIASYPKWIMLDGKRFHHKRPYRVTRDKASVLLDQMDRGWRQEAARKGEKLENLGPVRQQMSIPGGKYIETVIH